MMDGGLIDSLVVFFAVAYYAFLVIVYLVRAHNLSDIELKMALPFSAQVIPFSILWVLNILKGDTGRIISMTPIIVYLLYDLWYRLITRKKPLHHPDRWPKELALYLLLLMVGSIGLNWYGYLISEFYGMMLVAAFFVMLSSFGYYQYRYRKRKKR
ncbi:hypothetical protein H8E65_05285 [Candidatus Bathyarchaeota archaeon]|nr:hypothetical protein [Candidatus Bathyarchaeota archaeon]MBL7078812.1 hypothetical protein [Candidatus Bathyarchaeota archaeon]